MTDNQASYAFDTDTRVEPVGGGRYRGEVTQRWDTFLGTPNGGYLLAVCLRALTTELGVADPLAVSAHFLRPGRPGPAEVHALPVRAGRRISTGEARLLQDGTEVVRAVASFADLAALQGRSTLLAAPPELPPPDRCPDLATGFTEVPIAQRFRYRATDPPGWLKGEPSGNPVMEFWIGFSDRRPLDTLALPSLVDAAPPAVLELGEVSSATVQLTVHVRGRPSGEWAAARVATRFVTQGLHEEDFELWDEDGRLLAQSRQLALLAGPQASPPG